MADADAEHEATRPGFGQYRAAGLHGGGLAGPQVGDAGADDDPLGVGEQGTGVREGLLAADRLAGPDRAVPELVQPAHGGDLGGDRHRVERHPRPDPAQPLAKVSQLGDIQQVAHD